MYECPREGCSRVYSKAFNLKVHIQTFHEGNRPYQCTWEGCGKGFAHKVSLRQHLVLHSQKRIKPTPSPQDKSLQKKKKRRRPVSLAKQLSGYRSSLSESSDTHCAEPASRKRKTPNQPQRSEAESVMDTGEVNSVHADDGAARPSESSTAKGVTELTNLMYSSKDSVTTAANQDRSEGMQVDVTSSASTTLVSSSSSSTATIASQFRSEEMQGAVASASSSTLVSPCNNSATTSANEVRSEGMQGAVALTVSSTLVSSCSSSTATVANQKWLDGIQGVIASSALSTLVSPCENSAATSANEVRSEEMEGVIMSGASTKSSNQVRPEEMQGVVASSSLSALVSSCDNSAKTSSIHVRSEEMNGTVALASASSLVSSRGGSTPTIANQEWSKEKQSAVASTSSSTLVSPCNNSATTSSNQLRSEEMQGAAASATSSTLVSPCNNSATTSANQFRSEEMQGAVASASSSTLVSPCNNSATTFANQVRSEEMQGAVASAALSTLTSQLTSCDNSIANTDTDTVKGMQVEITSTPTSSNLQEQNAGRFTDDEMFPSSDEDGEGMEWEPVVSKNSEVHSLAECDFESEVDFEEITNNVDGSDNFCMVEDSPRDNRSSSAPPENGSTSLPERINAEMVSAALTAVSGSDSLEDDNPLSLLSEVSSLVSKAKTSAKRSQKIKNKNKKGRVMTFGDTSQDDGYNVDDLSSGSEEIVSVLQPDPPPADLKAFCNNRGIIEDVNTLGSTDFPGMDDILQVIIEEEENEVDSFEHETSLQDEDVFVEEGCVVVNNPGDASEESNYELVSSERQVINVRSPTEELNLRDGCESGGNLSLACGNQEKISPNNPPLSDEQDVLKVDSFNDVPNDYQNISNDGEGFSVLEQQKPTLDTSSPKMRIARDTVIDKQGCSSSLTRDTRQVEKSRGLTRDRGGNVSQVTREEDDKVGRATHDLTDKINNVDDLRSSGDITDDNSVPSKLPQSTSKASRKKNRENFGSKRSVNKPSSCSLAKSAAVFSTTTSQGGNAHRVNQVNGNNSEVKDVETQTAENSKPIPKPKEEPHKDVSKAKFRSKSNIFACDLQTLEVLWNFKGR